VHWRRASGSRSLLNTDKAAPSVPPEPFITAPFLIRGCFVTYSSLIGLVKRSAVGSEGINDYKGNRNCISRQTK